MGAGCYVQTKEAQALVDESIDIVIGNNQKHELVTLSNEYEKELTKQAQIVDINHEKQEYEELHLKKTAEHTRCLLYTSDVYKRQVMGLSKVVNLLERKLRSNER